MHAKKTPPLDQSRMLPYSAIRYVPGYPEQYVQEYARAYADARVQQALAKAVDLVQFCGGPEDLQDAIRAIDSRQSTPKEAK